MKWWNDIWLNEGFATFMTPKAIAACASGVGHRGGERAHRRASRWKSIRCAPRARSARTPETSAEINELFDGIAYGKTAAVLRMVEHWVGEESFRNGISAYLKKYSWSQRRGRGLLDDDGDDDEAPVDRVMTSFVMQPGAPVIAAKQSCANGERTVELTQERFVIAGGSNASQTWEVPICARSTASSDERCIVIDKPSQR